MRRGIRGGDPVLLCVLRSGRRSLNLAGLSTPTTFPLFRFELQYLRVDLSALSSQHGQLTADLLAAREGTRSRGCFAQRGLCHYKLYVSIGVSRVPPGLS